MKEEFPVTHPSQLAGNPALGLPLQLGHCDSCGATDLAKCEGDSLAPLCFIPDFLGSYEQWCAPLI
uniref:Uncharacterized protein n=1 Tax=Aegilops tauschii subsp. strangulata TaxID=200361 RepID=A0A453GTY3_AEGTS